jgi:hypothetical protein
VDFCNGFDYVRGSAGMALPKFDLPMFLGAAECIFGQQ